MKNVAAIAVCIALNVTYARFAISGEEPQAGSTSSPQVSASADYLHFVTVLTLRGKLMAVDPANRLVTIKDSKGKRSTLQVRSENDIESLKVGDGVMVRYFEGAQIRERPAQAGQVASLHEGIIGAEPSGRSKKEHALVMSVQSVDAMDQEITLKAADGSIETIMVSILNTSTISRPAIKS